MKGIGFAGVPSVMASILLENPLTAGLFWICLLMGEVLVGTLILKWIGRRRGFVEIDTASKAPENLQSLFDSFLDH